MATIIESSDDSNGLINLDLVETIESAGYIIVFKLANREIVWHYAHQQDCINDYQLIARCRLVNNK